MDDDAEGWYPLGPVGQRLQNLSPEFDTRTYGQPKLSDLVVATGRYEIDRTKGFRMRPKKAEREPRALTRCGLPAWRARRRGRL